jgi:hypothetical protein
MAHKTLNTRIQHKTDTTENWLKAKSFPPLKGELIIYQDSDNTQAKIGDGVTNVNDLPFLFNIPNLLQRIVDLETKLANLTYNEDTDTYIFASNITTEGSISEGTPNEEELNVLSLLSLTKDENGEATYTFNANVVVNGDLKENN